MNARRVRLQHPIDIDGRRVETLRVRWPALHLVDDGVAFLAEERRTDVAVALLTGLNAPDARRVDPEDVAAILDAAEVLLRR